MAAMRNGDVALAWMTLAKAPGLDPATLEAALHSLGGPCAVVAAPAAEQERAGIGPLTRAFLAVRGMTGTGTERRWLDAADHHLVPFTDERYPGLLRGLHDRPIALYVSGRLDALGNPQLAMVGSRNPTQQGCATAFDFAEHFATCGLGITSGVAEGIDACAHRGALRGGGITLGVLGTGIDVAYPAANRVLHEEIRRAGALISEFALGTPPRRANFPRRNRIIAALSLGTLVVEAARRSGSLITARLANDLGREVFAIPGSIHSPLSRGCHELIKAGAKLVDSADDILRELNFSAFFSNDHAGVGAGAETPADGAGMDKDHKILLDALGFDPVDLDTLIVRTGFGADVVSSMVLILELEGHVQAAPGGRYSRVAYRRAGGER